MAEEIAFQILSQASENIQKLFDLSTRIDERVKSIKEQQETLSDQLSQCMKDYNEVTKELAVLKVHSNIGGISSLAVKHEDSDKRINEIDKRLTAVESATDTQTDRWKQIASFIVQLVWIVVAAWAIMKLGLQSPPVP